MEKQLTEIIFRKPKIKDGSLIWKLVQDCGTLDVNSTYTYLLLCKYFADTCMVAELKGELVGFVTGYFPPTSDETLFLWQIGVKDSWRGCGIAKRLVMELIQTEACHHISFLEVTIGTSNLASRALFQSLAKKLNTEISQQPCFEKAFFPEGNHEAEDLFRIGPL